MIPADRRELARAERAEALCANYEAERTEWLCEQCNKIHPTQQPGKVLQLCPDCDSAMCPTSYSLRRIKELQAERDALRRDAERYRFIRREDIATEPKYYQFWSEMQYKLCREGKMDALIDQALAEEKG